MSRLLISGLVLFFTVGAVHAADVVLAPASTGHHSSSYGSHNPLPYCEEPDVVSRIAEKFAYADQRIMQTGLVIANIDGIHERDLRAGGPGFVDRRYCGAVATLSNGGTSEVVYLIESGQGFASHGWNVESCLPAFDPWHVYGSWCRSLRP